MDIPESSRNLKGYKIRKSLIKCTTDVQASSLSDLMSKAKRILEIPKNEEVQIFWKGTEVHDDEDLQKIPSQAEFMIQRAAETYDDVEDGLYHLLVQSSISLSQEKKRSFADSFRDKPNARYMLKCLVSLEVNIEAEKRNEHKDWFEGLGAKWVSKTGWMRELAARRMRNCFNHAKEKMTGMEIGKLDEILKTSEPLMENTQAQKNMTEEEIRILDRILKAVKLLRKNAQEKMTKEERERNDETLKILEKQLKDDDYNRSIFDRRAGEADRMCDESGEFCCRGLYNNEGRCEHEHFINPYACKSHRLMFKDWELDHIIEKSFVLESFIEAARRDTPQGDRLDKDKLYELLFTRSNLNLVYIDCHDRNPRQNEQIDWIIPAVQHDCCV